MLIGLGLQYFLFFELQVEVAELMQRHTDPIFACIVDRKVEMTGRQLLRLAEFEQGALVLWAARVEVQVDDDLFETLSRGLRGCQLTA